MGGAKKTPIAQAEKRQDAAGASKDEKKGKKSAQTSVRSTVTFKVDDAEASKIFSQLKAITIFSATKSLGVNASTAWSTIKNFESKGLLEKVGGYSGHYVYKYAGLEKPRH